MIAVEQKMEHYPVFAIDLLNPDFAQYAECCGGVGISVQKPEDLKAAIARALTVNKPVIVDIETDPRRFERAAHTPVSQIKKTSRPVRV